jgi:ribosome-binding factor A
MTMPAAPHAKSHRLLRVGELLRHAIVEILTRGDIRDPALAGASVTVTEVRVSPDLHNATVYIMPLGGVHSPEVLAGLSRSAGYIRGQVSKAVTLRYVPKLAFEIDQTFDEADRIESLLRDPKVARDLGHDAVSDEPES